MSFDLRSGLVNSELSWSVQFANQSESSTCWVFLTWTLHQALIGALSLTSGHFLDYSHSRQLFLLRRLPCLHELLFSDLASILCTWTCISDRGWCPFSEHCRALGRILSCLPSSLGTQSLTQARSTHDCACARESSLDTLWSPAAWTARACSLSRPWASCTSLALPFCYSGWIRCL